jgi:hypothetical protein
VWNSDALSISIPADLLIEDRYTLSEDIYAMQLLPGNGVNAILGPVVKIPKGKELEGCGPGFNERTMKVRCDGFFYFVFLQDLELQRKPAAKAAYAN